MNPRASRGKTRVDVLLVERDLAPSRARAQALVMAGAVWSGEIRIDKAGALLDPGVDLRVVGPGNPYVSRGGIKLEAALNAFARDGLVVEGVVAADIGASTGGFTDCLLSRGARKVYAIDVGYGQLSDKLRRDPRVVVRERTNARRLSASDFEEPVDLVVVDASFIGLAQLAPPIASILRPAGTLVALAKPQFEAGRAAATRGRGVIRDPAVRASAIASARAALETVGFQIRAELDSPIAGPKGNLERFLLATRGMNQLRP